MLSSALTYPVSACAFKAALSKLWQEWQKRQNPNFCPGRVVSFSGTGTQFKHCESVWNPHLGSLPAGGQNFLDKNWTTLRIFGMYVLRTFFRLNRVLPEDYCKEDPCNFPWDGELARNWPRVDTNFWATPCTKSCPSAFMLFSSTKLVPNPAGWGGSWPRVGHGLPTFRRENLHVEIAWVFLAVVLWQDPIEWRDPSGPLNTWATAFLIEQGTNIQSPLSSETLQNEIYACKTRSDTKSKAWSVSRTRSERDTKLHN